MYRWDEMSYYILDIEMNTQEKLRNYEPDVFETFDFNIYNEEEVY